MSSFKTAPMTAPEAGKFLRDIAEMTARNSQNWDNFEAIAADLIKSAYEGGQAATPPQVDSGREEIARIDWQPIETAPKDGEMFILVFCPEDGSRWLASWQGGRNERASWFGVDDMGLTRSSEHYEVTLWQPLPEPPLTLRPERSGGRG